MENLVLQPAMELARERLVVRPLCLAAELCVQSPPDVWLMADGRLATAGRGEQPAGDRERQLFALACVAVDVASGQYEWLLMRRERSVQLNGIAILPVASLKLGDLLACGRQRWLVTSLWRPAPRSAPPAAMNSDCPVCGAPLSAAPVVQCPCGRYSHLENPAQPHDSQALNCYLLAGACGLCGRAASLQPALLPEPDELLVAAESVEETLGALTAGAL